MPKPRSTPERAAVTERHQQLRLNDQVPYWIVMSYADGQALLADRVPDTVKAQVSNVLKREASESQAEYVARISEGRVRA